MRELVAALLVGAPFLVGASVAPEGDGEVVWRFEDPRIVESSGLVADDDLVVTVNDSGDSARIFVVDRGTGRTVGETRWDADPEDVEALAPAGPGQVWVGDIGDNLRARSSITVTKVPYGRGTRAVPGESHTLTYPAEHGAQDAEALLVHPRTGRLYVVTKGVLAGRFYAAPRTLGAGEGQLRAIGTAPGLVTDGAFFDDGAHVLLRGYGAATVLTFPGLEQVGSFRLPRQQQGEGVAIAPDGEILLSSEGVRSPLLRIELPPEVRQAMTAGPPSALPSPSPTPSAAPSPPADRSDPESDDGSLPDGWPWLLGGALGAVAIVVLLRSLRTR